MEEQNDNPIKPSLQIRVWIYITLEEKDYVQIEAGDIFIRRAFNAASLYNQLRIQMGEIGDVLDSDAPEAWKHRDELMKISNMTTEEVINHIQPMPDSLVEAYTILSSKRRAVITSLYAKYKIPLHATFAVLPTGVTEFSFVVPEVRVAEIVNAVQGKCKEIGTICVYAMANPK